MFMTSKNTTLLYILIEISVHIISQIMGGKPSSKKDEGEKFLSNLSIPNC